MSIIQALVASTSSGSLANQIAFSVSGSFNEGGSVTVQIIYTNFRGSTVYWTAVGDTRNGAAANPSSDLTGDLTGSTYLSGSGSFNLTYTSVVDHLTEGTEWWAVKMGTYPGGADYGISEAININDTSTTPVPTYSLSASAAEVNEGSTNTITVTTTNVSDGTTLYWTVSGYSDNQADASDFVATSGSFTITGNTGTFDIQTVADHLTEGTQGYALQVRTDSITGYEVISVGGYTILDTSVATAPVTWYGTQIDAPIVGAYSHDLTHGYYTLNAGSFINTGRRIDTSTFTVSVTADMHAYSAGWSVLWGNDHWFTPDGYVAYFDGKTDLRFGAPEQLTSATVPDITAQAYTYVVVFDGTTKKAYVNGELVATGTLTSYSTPSDTYMLINSRHSNDGVAVATDSGEMRYYSARVYNSAFTDAQVQGEFLSLPGVHAYVVRSWINDYSGGNSTNVVTVLQSDYPNADKIPVGATTDSLGSTLTVTGSFHSVLNGQDVWYLQVDNNPVVYSGTYFTFTWTV